MTEPSVLQALLRYESETGKLFWLPRPLSMFANERCGKAWNTRFAGKEAVCCIHTHGYKFGSVLGDSVFAHRVIWAIKTGAWPTGEIDHIDGQKDNNVFSNLRIATRTENLRNTRSRSTSTSQYLGVCWDTRNRKWLAQIVVCKKTKSLGRFRSEIDAAKAYDAAAVKYFGEFANPNFPLKEKQNA